MFKNQYVVRTYAYFVFVLFDDIAIALRNKQTVGCTLYVIIEGAVLVSVLLEQTERVVIAEILELNQCALTVSVQQNKTSASRRVTRPAPRHVKSRYVVINF